jgi:hypothetical protein
MDIFCNTEWYGLFFKNVYALHKKICGPQFADSALSDLNFSRIHTHLCKVKCRMVCDLYGILCSVVFMEPLTLYISVFNMF